MFKNSVALNRLCQRFFGGVGVVNKLDLAARRDRALAHAVRATSRWEGLESLEQRLMLSGVTLIAPGFDDSITGWVGAMAAAIADTKAVDASIYTIKATDGGSSNNLPITVTLLPGVDGVLPTAASTANPEIILLLDWSDMAGSFIVNGGSGLHTRSTVDVASAVTAKLLQPGFLPDLGLTHTIAEMPMHLIGHSRGGSLVSELAKDLGKSGVWVDQLTMLDPVPAIPGDAPPQASSNVTFADDYYQNTDPSIVARGTVVNGAYQVPLDLPGGNPGLPITGWGGDHNDVHSWYHGTIDNLTANPFDGAITVPTSQWYPSQAIREHEGYYFSQIVGGTRPSVGSSFYFGGPVNDGRVTVSPTSTEWPNIAALSTGQTTFTQGQSIPVNFMYSNYANAADMQFYLDTDQNPYNGAVSSTPDGALSVNSFHFGPTPGSAIVNTTNIQPGTYYLRAVIKDVNFERFAYLPQKITIQPSDGTPPTATLYFPVNATSVAQALMNSTPKYIDVTFTDAGGLNTASILDAGQEFTLSGSGVGSAVVNGVPALQSGTRYRYTFTGNFDVGSVTLTFPAGAFADLAGNANTLATQGFTITAAQATLVGLSISGPASVNENSSATYTATASFDDGTTATVNPSWTVNSGVATVSSSGVLSAGSVTSDTAIQVSASYTTGGVTKAATTGVTVLNQGGSGTVDQQLIINGGFEAGTSSWTAIGAIVVNHAEWAHGGSNYGYLGETANADDRLSQTITVPSNAISASLSYWVLLLSDDHSATAHDFLTSTIRNTSNNVLSTVETLSNLNQPVTSPPGTPAPQYYHQVTFNLLPFKGQTVQIYFEAVLNATLSTYCRVDDVSAVATVPTAPTLSSLLISGPSSVPENSTAQFSATAVYSDGSSHNVNPSWSTNSGIASISSSGFVNVGAVNADTSINISASYTDGVTQMATKAMTILNVPPALSYINVTGANSLQATQSTQYQCIAVFSDNSTQNVTSSASWSVNPTTYASINGGSLTTSQVPSDQYAAVTATYQNVSQSLGVTIQAINHAPMDIGLSGASVAENQPVGTWVGTFSTTDPDVGNRFTYGLVSGTGATDNGSFTISSGNQLLTGASFNYETKNSYSIRVQSTDQGGLPFQKVFTIVVADLNEPPTVSNFAKAVNQNATLTLAPSDFSTVYTDPDTGSTPHSLTSIQITTGPTHGVLMFGASGAPLNTDIPVASTSTLTYIPTTGYTGSDSFVWNGSDGSLYAASGANANITVNAVNHAPTDIALSSASVAENQPVGAIIGSLSTTDQDAGNTFTYSLVTGTSSTDNASFTISGNTLKTTAIFNFEAKSSYSIRVQSTDQGGLSTQKAFTISVTNVNEAPTVNTVAKSIAQNATLTLATGDFTAAFADPDTGNTLQKIKITSLPTHGTVKLGTTAVALSQEIAVGSLGTLVYIPTTGYSGSDTFGWNGSDGSLYATSGASVNITVNAVNHAPTDIALSSASVAENQPVGTIIGSFSTTDQDAGNTFTYSLVTGVGSTDNALFTISGNTLKTAAIFNFEAKNSYSIRVQSTDQGSLSTQKALTITVTNVNEAPTISTFTKAVTQNATLTLAASDFTASFVDLDAGNTLQKIKITSLPTHGTLKLGTTAVTLNQEIVAGSIGTLTYIPTTGFSGADTFGWNASDGSLYAASGASLNITVSASVNHAPTDITFSSASIAENRPVGTTIGNFSTTDPDSGNTFTYSLVSGTGSTDNTSFTISGGALKTTAIFNFEVKNSYSVRLQSTDQGGLSTQKAFTITVTNVNEVPTVSTFAKSVTENATLTLAATDFTAVFVDPDVGNTLQKIKITSLPAHGTLKLGTAAVTLNQEIVAGSIGTLTYIPTASYAGGDSFGWNGSDGSLYAASATSVSITVNPPGNHAPTDISISGGSIAENQPGGTTVGNFSTTDPDASNTFSYGLVTGTGGTDNASFTITGGTLKTAAIFNFEAKSSYSIRVQSTDQGGLSTQKAFTITVTNVNEPPTVRTSTQSLAQSATLMFVAADFISAFADPDAGATLQKIKISSLPTHGTLKLGLTAVTLNQEIAVGSIGALVYIATPGYSGSDAFGWNASDGSLYAINGAQFNLTGISSHGALSPVATITASESNILIGDTEILTASVTSINSTPTGTVTFLDGSTSLGTVPLANGIATMGTNTLAFGLHSITFSYSGDSSFSTTVSALLDVFVGNTKNEVIVNALYRQLLNRDAEETATGLYSWTGQMANGAPLSKVADGIATSVEYDTNIITGIYKTYLHRDPDLTGLQNWVGQMQASTVSYETIRGYILGSQEFRNNAVGLHGDYVTGLYWELLGRSPEPLGWATWTAMLGAGADDTQRDPVSIGISTSFEQYGNFVTQKFQQFLGRAPTPATAAAQPSVQYVTPTNPNGIPTPTNTTLQGEQGYWADSLNLGLSDGDFIADILSSTEYLLLQGLPTS
jgi:hypothetical protein